MNEKKKVAITVYLETDFADKLNKQYAKAVLNGYNGTKQQFYNWLLKCGLARL